MSARTKPAPNDTAGAPAVLNWAFRTRPICGLLLVVRPGIGDVSNRLSSVFGFDDRARIGGVTTTSDRDRMGRRMGQGTAEKKPMGLVFGFGPAMRIGR